MPLANGTKIEVPLHSENIRLLWAQTTVYTPEYGEEIHPAGLVLLGKNNEIKSWVWRAQTNLVFPIIDELRIKIYSLLKDKYSPNTWDHQDVPEIGQINILWSNCHLIRLKEGNITKLFVMLEMFEIN